MSLAYRLGTVAFIMAMMALALYILTAGILGRRIHRQIDNVNPPGLVQLVRPAGIQIVPPHKKIEERFQRRVFPDQISVGPQGSHHLRKVIFQQVIRLGFIGHHQHAPQIGSVRKDFAGLIKLCQVAGKQLRHQPFAHLFVRDQLLIKGIAGKTLVEQILQFGEVLFLYPV